MTMTQSSSSRALSTTNGGDGSQLLLSVVAVTVVFHLIFFMKQTTSCLIDSEGIGSTQMHATSKFSRQDTKPQPPVLVPSRKEKNAISKMVQRSLGRMKTSSLNRTLVFHENNERCAINFYGLPRSFFTMTLPSIIENILIPNAAYDCDFFVHYHYLTEEKAGRSGAGGKLNPDEVLLLEEAVRQVGEHFHGPSYIPIIRFGNYTDEDLWKNYGSFLNRTRVERDVYDSEQRLLFLPWRDSSYTFTQVDNIAKMWHSQKSGFQLIEKTGQELGINYTRVAMFRSDVFFLTPMDIWKNTTEGYDLENRIAVFAGFARYPTNDRMVIGPFNAIKVWATERFELIEAHVLMTMRRGHGWGVQSEWFLDQTVLPAMERQGALIREDFSMCFLRVRPHENIWTNEGCPSTMRVAAILQDILNRDCRMHDPGGSTKPGAMNMYCPIG